jgi:uncharacterized protein YcaQ
MMWAVFDPSGKIIPQEIHEKRKQAENIKRFLDELLREKGSAANHMVRQVYILEPFQRIKKSLSLMQISGI